MLEEKWKTFGPEERLDFTDHLKCLIEEITCFAFLLMVEEDEGRFLLEGRCSLAFCFALKKGSVVK